MEAQRSACTSPSWEPTPGVGICDPFAAESKECDGSTRKPVNKVVSFGDHIHGTPPGEAEFLVIRSQVNGHHQKTIRKVVFRDNEDIGENMNAWILRVLTSELDTLKSFPVPAKLVDIHGQFVSHEVNKIKGDAEGGSWLIYNFKGPQTKVTIEYGYNAAEKDCETEGMETDTHEVPCQMDEVKPHKPLYLVRSLL